MALLLIQYTAEFAASLQLSILCIVKLLRWVKVCFRHGAFALSQIVKQMARKRNNCQIFGSMFKITECSVCLDITLNQTDNVIVLRFSLTCYKE